MVIKEKLHMEIAEIYHEAEKLERLAFCKIALLIKDFLKENGVHRMTWGYGVEDENGYGMDIDLKPIVDLVDEYEEYFSMFDPQMTYSNGTLHTANYGKF